MLKFDSRETDRFGVLVGSPDRESRVQFSRGETIKSRDSYHVSDALPANSK
jgi:hypothetical protein